MSNQAWTEPGIFEVVPGVYRLPLPLPNDGLRAVNVYVITGPDGPVLIDSGWAIPLGVELMTDGLREIGTEIADIQRFLITHVHRDHYSQALDVRRRFGTRVTLGAGERHGLEYIEERMRSGRREPNTNLVELGAGDLAEKMFANQPKHNNDDAEMPTDWFTPNELIDANGRSLEVVETPGHTRGHVVFYDNANTLLFAGDHVLPSITPSIGFEPKLSPNPLGSFLDSLAIVRARPDAMLLPAHGAVTPSVHARVDELIEHHRQRLDKMSRALADGAMTAKEVASRVTWTRREHQLSDLDLFNSFLAISETGAHLNLLVAQGKVTVSRHDGVRQYVLR